MFLDKHFSTLSSYGGPASSFFCIELISSFLCVRTEDAAGLNKQKRQSFLARVYFLSLSLSFQALLLSR